VNDEIRNLVVAGVDGSPSSTAAALWAAAEAQRRGAELSLVHAYSVPLLPSGPGVPPPDIGAATAEAATAILDNARDVVTTAYPGLTVTTLAREESPVTALQTASRHAAVTVVGSHGRHQLTETLLGSVAARVTGHAHSPVVVIRTDPDGRPQGGGEGPVVVGLDGSAESDDALAFALQAAASRRTSLIAVRSWDNTALDGLQGSYPVTVDRDQLDLQEQQLLADQLHNKTGNFPEVPVHQKVLWGRPATTLLSFCEDAGSFGRPCLLVVGSRGRGGFAGMVLGSTSHALIARATCGVAVIRPDTSD
jgi:nucleotide-binding universal stress UspA family protein